MSGMLKNTIDWISRRGHDDRIVTAFSGKIAGLMAAGSSAHGGLRGLGQLRHVLTSVGVLVIPQQRAVGGGTTAFGEDGLKDPAQQAAIDAIAARVVDLVRRHAD
jgi:NAD(P)H-dependent FMN reductase